MTTRRERILSNTETGARCYRPEQEDGSLSSKDALHLDLKADAMTYFLQELSHIEPVKSAKFVATDDLPHVGRIILEATGLPVIYAQTKANKVSYAEMENAFVSSTSPETTNCINISLSLVGIHPEIAARQVFGLVTIFHHWEIQRPGKLCMAGSLIEGEHDPDTILAAINGTEHLTLKNLWKVFPTNAMSLVRPNSWFSNVTDNGRLGMIEVDGEQEKIGGNEDFYYAFLQMLQGHDCILLINPSMPAERQAKIETVGKKVRRREKVYDLYARMLIAKELKRREVYKSIEEAVKRDPTLTIDISGNSVISSVAQKSVEIAMSPARDPNSFSEEEILPIVEETIDKHLFFARLDKKGELEINLTRRQRSKIPIF